MAKVLSDEECEAIVRQRAEETHKGVLERNPNTKCVKLVNAPIDPEILSVMCESPCYVTHLTLWHVGVDRAMCEVIGQMFARNTSLVYVNLNCCAEIGKNYKPIAEGLRQNSTIKTLCLGWTSLNSNSAGEILRALKGNTSLTKLDLGMNPGLANCRILRRILTCGSAINAVTLSMIKFTRRDMLDMCEVLSTEAGHGLVSLDCSSCGIRNDFASMFARALETNKTLRHFNFSYNSCRDVAGAVFAKMLCVNDTLETLEITDANLKNKSGLEFACALEHNTTLRSLDLCNNVFTRCVDYAMIKAMATNTTLVELDIDECYFEETSDLLEATLKRNKSLFENIMERWRSEILKDDDDDNINHTHSKIAKKQRIN